MHEGIKYIQSLRAMERFNDDEIKLNIASEIKLITNKTSKLSDRDLKNLHILEVASIYIDLTDLNDKSQMDILDKAIKGKNAKGNNLKSAQLRLKKFNDMSDKKPKAPRDLSLIARKPSYISIPQ